MDRTVFYAQLASLSDNPTSIKFIIVQFFVVSIMFATIYGIDKLNKDLKDVLLGLCRIHIKLFTLYGLLGTVVGMINLFYTASIGLDSRWIALGLANTIKPSLLGMICSIFTSVFYYTHQQRKSNET